MCLSFNQLTNCFVFADGDERSETLWDVCVWRSDTRDDTCLLAGVLDVRKYPQNVCVCVDWINLVVFLLDNQVRLLIRIGLYSYIRLQSDHLQMIYPMAFCVGLQGQNHMCYTTGLRLYIWKLHQHFWSHTLLSPQNTLLPLSQFKGS